MGKPDARQPRLVFDKKTPKPAEGDQATQDNAEEHTASQASDDDIKAMFRDLKTSLHGIDTKIDTLVDRMDKMTQRMETQEGRLDGLETRVSEVEDGQSTMTSQMLKMDEVLNIIKQKNEDLEARSRRNNVRITGILKTTDIPNMEQYVEHMMSELFGSALSKLFLIERAHRTLSPKPPPGATPRPILVRVLNYRDRDIILRSAREKDALQYQGNTIAIYLDFTVQVQAARREFLPAKKIFQQIGTKYALLYPAKLKILGLGKPQIFTDAKAALTYAKQMAREQKKQVATKESLLESRMSDND